jgi:hypothetical protein
MALVFPFVLVFKLIENLNNLQIPSLVQNMCPALNIDMKHNRLVSRENIYMRSMTVK